MKNELISIIVPVYNISNYIERAVVSLLEQSYKNIEILLIDDGSTDSSSLICDDLTKRDSRIKCFHKKNGGLSDARNYGIEKSKGKYLFFLDGDDYIYNKAIEYLYRKLIDNDCDIATFYHQRFNELKCPNENFSYLKEFVYNTEDSLNDMLYIKNISNSSCGKLFKKSLFKTIRFPVNKICEDLGTTYKVFAKSSKCFASTAQMYYYYFRENSIVNSKFSVKRMDGLYFAQEQKRYIYEYFPKLKKAALNREFRECMYIYNVICNNVEFSYELSVIKNIIKKYRFQVLFDNNSSFKIRIFAFMSLFKF